METVSVLILTDLTLGRRIRLARIAKGLRQMDLASITRLQSYDITDAEKDRRLARWKLKKILQALDLEKDREVVYG